MGRMKLLKSEDGEWKCMRDQVEADSNEDEHMDESPLFEVRA